MPPPEQQMDALCRLVDRLARAQDNHQALAYACLSICWLDTSRYAHAINAPGLHEEAARDGAAHIETAFEALDERRFALMRRMPAAMLYWLARRAASVPLEAPHTYAETTYSGDVFAYPIEPRLARELGFPRCWRKVYLAPQSHSGCQRARAAQQGLSQQRFTPGWYVLPDSPDQNQGSRKVEIVGVDGRLRADLHAIRRRGKIRIYLAEFSTPPVFLPQPARQDPCYWTALGLANEAAIVDEALAHLRRALAMDADVLLFPELTISRRVRESLADELARSNAYSALALVIAGSFHERLRASNQARNVTYALDRFGDPVRVLADRNSRQAWCHVKQNPVTISDGDGRLLLRENLRPGSLVTLLHTPLGLQSIVTCLDLAQAAVASALRLEFLPQSLLWVPSTSPGVSAHLSHAKNLQLNHNTIVACANQARAQLTAQYPIAEQAGQSFVLAGAGRPPGTTAGHGVARLFDVAL